MIAELFDLGFLFFEGMTLSQKTIDYFLNPSNYKGYYNPEEHIREIGTIPPEILADINGSFPLEIVKIINNYSINWGANMAEQGFELVPHNDMTLDEIQYSAGSSAIIFWICSEDFIGREFVWGKVLDMAKLPKDVEGYSNNGWNDPNLEEIGRIKPKTGTGVIIDRTNPIWWHGVTKLLTDTKIVTVVGYD